MESGASAPQQPDRAQKTEILIEAVPIPRSKHLREPALCRLDTRYYGQAGLQGNKQRLATELEAILRDQRFRT